MLSMNYKKSNEADTYFYIGESKRKSKFIIKKDENPFKKLLNLNLKDLQDYFKSLTTLQPEVEVTEIICREICSGTVAITDGFYNFRILQNLTRIIVSARFTFVLERTGTKWYILSHHSSKKADAS